jgi:hypothetical protein
MYSIYPLLLFLHMYEYVRIYAVFALNWVASVKDLINVTTGYGFSSLSSFSSLCKNIYLPRFLGLFEFFLRFIAAVYLASTVT